MYKCLIVEDEKIIRKWLHFGVDYGKYHCVVIDEAKDGREGAEKIRTLKPDIVITDITMPNMNAFAMLEEVKDQLFATIVVSGYNDFENAQQAIRFGATEFIVKPINRKELEKALGKSIQYIEAQRLFYETNRQIRQAERLVIKEKTTSGRDPVVKEMLHFVEEHYAEKFLFKQVAEAVGYGQSILYKRFREDTGQTFGDYLNAYRVQKSIEKIKRGEHKLFEISEEVGFSDYKYFSKIFKKHTGYSPKNFIELCIYVEK
jgi:two-component system response regulator YesN